MWKAILIESRVVMSILRLRTRNTLCTVREVYMMVEIQVKKMLSQFCRSVRVHLHCTFVQFPSPTGFKVFM